MYHLYHTDAFILGSEPRGEANRHLILLTRSFGLLTASAQGVRFLKSKLRYHLEDRARTDVTLVRGKSRWRIVGAHKQSSLHDSFCDRPEREALFVRVFALLRRLLPEEEVHEAIFDSIADAHAYLSQEVFLSKDALFSAECLLLLRLLRELGYLGDTPEFHPLLISSSISTDILASLSPLRMKAIQEINRSLRETHL